MKGLLKKNNLTDVQIHIDKAFKIIDEYLPEYYVDEVLKKLTKNPEISRTLIYNVRKKMSKRLDIINAMVEVALEHKKLQQRLIKQVS